MKTYLVGGAVRDYRMGNIPKDLDFVVVGETAESMLAAGFKQVGADFPVFLHPDSGYEYALARTERSTGSGYKDFTTETNGVTLEDDLRRRDLTINAMATSEGDQLIDPFGGQKDMRDRVLRHVDDDGFVEDPLRVLRLARFCAKFPSYSVAKETKKLCKKMVADGMLNHLTPERVGTEMLKAFRCKRPVRFFYFLQMVGALEVVFPELHAMVGVPAGPWEHHPEGDAFVHTMMVVDQVTKEENQVGTPDEYSELVHFCALVHDLGKGNTPADVLPHHYGHEARGVPLVEAMCKRLRLSNDFLNYGKVVAKYHTHVHNVFQLNAKTIVGLVDELQMSKLDKVVDVLVQVSHADARGRGPFFENAHYPNLDKMWCALRDAYAVKARHVCTEDELKNVNVLKNKLFHARVAAVKKVFGS